MRKRLTQVSRMLRKNATPSERVLWSRLRNRQLAGHRFRRQQPIGDYIVDFVCLERKLIIELDGGQHAIDSAIDAKRDAWMESQGFNVVRFWNHAVLTNTDGVVETIYQALIERADDVEA